MTDPAMAPDLDRLLSAAHVPAMPGSLIDRIVAEAMRADRVALPPSVPSRRRGRWARRGVRGGIVAAGLMFATAVAAAFGGGAPIFATIATVARHVVEHIRHPFAHAAPVAAPVRAPVVHRMAVPSSAIGMTPHGGLPMTAPHPLVGTAPMVRRGSIAPIPVIHALRMPPGRHDHAVAIVRPASHPIAHDGPRSSHRHAVRSPPHHPMVRGSSWARFTTAEHRDALPHTPIAAPVVPRVDAAPEPAPFVAQPSIRDGGLRAEGGSRVAGPPVQPPSPMGQGNGFRRPGWRRQQMGGGMGPNGNPKPNPPGWRRRGGMPHPKPPRPGGGGHRRRF